MVTAWLELDALTCGDCGTRKDEWGWWDADGKFHRHRPAPYIAKATTCPGCEALEEHEKTAAKKSGGRPRPRSWRNFLTAG